MMTNLCQFLERLQSDTYPEPDTVGHVAITEKFIPQVCATLKPRAHVLDAGCGQGVALKRFEARGFNVVGTTLNAEDFTKLKIDFPGRVHFCEQNNMPADWSGCFDLVWARHVLEHSIMPYFTLSEYMRVLKPKGVCYIEVPAPGTPCHHEANKNHYSVLTLQMWLQLISRTGFSIQWTKETKFKTPVGQDKYWGFLCRK